MKEYYMNKKELRNYFYNHKDAEGKRDLIIRIRDEKDKDAKDDIIYYNGIKILEISNGQIKIGEPNIYKYNMAIINNALQEENENINDRDKAVKENVVNAITKMRKSVFDKGLITYKNNPSIRLEKIINSGHEEASEESLIYILESLKKMNKKIMIKFHDKKATLTKYLDTDEREILDLIKNHIHKYDYIDFILCCQPDGKDIAEMEYLIRRCRNFDENLKYVKISSPKSTPFELLKKSINDSKELDEIVKICQENTKTYETKVKFEKEKNYQFQFMLSDTMRKKLKYEIMNRSVPYNKIEEKDWSSLYPFEQEYFILNESGRVDSIFFDMHEDNTADLYLIELKVNENVVGGENGVHKHLFDIKELMKERETFLEEILEQLKYRRRELYETDTITEINSVHFWTVIGYTDELHHELCQKLLSTFYNDEKKDCLKELNILKDKYRRKGDIDVNNLSYPKKHFEMQHPLKKFEEEIGNSCDIRFFFDEWHTINKTEYQIMDKAFEIFMKDK